MPNIQILIFRASKSLFADFDLVHKPLGYLKGIEECERIDKGYSVEAGEENKVYVLISWSSYEAFEKIQNGDDYLSFFDSLKLLVEGPLTDWHFKFDIDTNDAINSPVSEVAIVVPKEGNTLEEVMVISKKVRDATLQCPAIYGFAIGESEQAPGAIAYCIGYDSVQAHVDAVNNTSPLHELVFDELLPSSNIQYSHIAFKPF